MSARFNSGAECTFFAQPYAICAVGFYFSDMQDYQAKAAAALDDYGVTVEEFEIQYIDGDFAELFAALAISQATLPEWFDLAEMLEAHSDRYLIACHLAELGYGIADLPDHWDNYHLFRGSAADYAADLVESCYTVPEGLQAYIDYDRFARDLILGGDIDEIDHNLILVRG